VGVVHYLTYLEININQDEMQVVTQVHLSVMKWHHPGACIDPTDQIVQVAHRQGCIECHIMQNKIEDIA
jgi:hypothetical protein